MLTACAVFGLAAALLPGLRPSTRFLVAWDLGALTYLALILVMFGQTDEARLQRRADRENAGAVWVLIVSIAAALASFVAIVAELRGLKDQGIGVVGAGRVGLAAATVLVSWLFLQTVFAVHYAHDYYAGETDRGGLKFPSDEPPDYWDFLYFAANLGAAAQTSDVAITSARMRRFVLGHTILAFLFNTTILALAINVGASLL